MTNSTHISEKKISIGQIMSLVFIYFLFLYPFQVPGLPFGTVIPILGILSLIVVVSFIRGYRPDKNRTFIAVRKYWFWNIFLLLYVFGILQVFGTGDGDTPLNDYLQMLIILPFFYISGGYLFSDVEQLAKVLYIGVVIQSIIIIIGLFSPTITIGLTMLLPQGTLSELYGGFEEAIAGGYKVGLGVFTSAGSLRMAIGQIGALYYLNKTKGAKLFFHLILFLLVTIATSVVSRTGLLVSVVGLLVVFLVKLKQGGHRSGGFVILIIVLLVTGYTVVTSLFTNNFLEDTFQRFIFTAEVGIHDGYFRGYLGEGGDNTIPPISPETIIGLGITKGVSGSGITTITDGGFMRNYSAMGLVVAIINYIIISVIFFKQYKSTRTYEYKGILIYIFLIFIIGEFKEYYIYYISPMCFFFLFINLIERSEHQLHLYLMKDKKNHKSL